MELFWNLIKSVVLGIVQGITEWLPISSTGHMLLLDEVMQLSVSREFRSMFFVVIQFGSILAVLFLYFHKLNPFSPRKSGREKAETLQLWSKVVVAAIPAGVVGILFNDVIDRVLSVWYVIALALIVYGVLFIVLEKRNRRRPARISSIGEMGYGTAFWIGVVQILALVPGTSRSGSTILGAILLGCSRQLAAEFSFFLAVPMMVGASGVRLLDFGFHFTGEELAILFTGTLVSFIVSVFAIRFLVGYIKKHDFTAFGWYRIALGAVVLLYFGLVA